MRLRQSWYSLLAVLVWVCAIGLTSCNPHTFRATEARTASQLVARTNGDPKTFNPALADSVPYIFPFTFEGLIREDGKGNLIPGLAESWKISDDKLKITFTLRQGLKWSDGQPLTVDDVLFTFNQVYFNPDIPTGTRDVLRIGQKGLLPSLKQSGDRQVEFTLPESFAPFLRAVGSPILPAHILRPSVQAKDAKGNLKFLSVWGTDTDPREIVVNGPYRMVSYVTSQRVVFERNPYYWRKDAQGKQLPYIDRLVWQIIESPEPALIQFRSGGLDTVGIGPASFSLLKREEKRGNFRIYNAGPDSGISFIGFNLNQGRRNGKPLIDPIKSRWFNTVEFRQAVAYGINRQAMINNFLRGLGQLQSSPISVQSPYYMKPSDGLRVYNYDPDQSRRLLQSAGFKYNQANQLFDADGNRVRFTLTTSSGGGPAREGQLSQIKQNLEKIGMQVDLQFIDFGTLVERLSNSLNLEAFSLGFTGGVEPNNASNLWLPEGNSHLFNQKPQPGQSPIQGWQVADWERRIGDIFIAAARELDESKRKALYGEMQQIAQEKVPLIYMINPYVLAAVRNRVEGVDLSSLQYESTLWNVADLKLKPE
ncbi:MAG: ABC transporter substrate-binding protein [Leptolyngbyaceae cyanobacterium]